MYKLELLGWKTWYADGEIYGSDEYDWLDIPRNGMVVLKKYYHAFDAEGKKIIDEESGCDTFEELVYGHSMVVLSIDEIKQYEVLPRFLKFTEQMDTDELHEFIEKATNDKEIPCPLTEKLQTK